MTDIRPFTLAIAQEQLDDLNRRIDATRWPEKETVDDWSQGVPLAALQDFVAYWRNGYDWRACEARLNAFGQYITQIDGLDIHFLHIRSPDENAMPLILTHGWPGSVIEFVEAIGPLTDPVAHGGRAEDAVHVVAPSLPGYGFSAKPAETGWNVQRIARAWAQLMKRLGYTRWVAQGGDWGAFVTSCIGSDAPEGCAGIHVNLVMGGPTKEARENPTEEEREAFQRMQYYNEWDSGYSKQQSTRPQTLGYGLVDSPVGLAGWIYEKMWAWTDNQGKPEDALSRDTMLDNIMLYWLPANGASSARLYWQSFSQLEAKEILIPSGASNFPKEIMYSPRSWAERRMKNLVYWNKTDRGGHFAAWEQPALFVDELRKCFALMR